MSTRRDTIVSTEAAILSRLIRPDEDDLPNEAAQALLLLHFDESDLTRLHDLVTKNQDDALTRAEKRELEIYLRVSSFVDLMQAKARRSLKKHA